MARKKEPLPSATFWSSANFWQPTYRSWPWPPDRLEVLANRIGVTDDELRLMLVTEIARRQSAQSVPKPSRTTPLSQAAGSPETA